MNKRFILIPVLGFSLFLLPTTGTLQAQNETPRFEIFGQFGPSFLTGKTSQTKTVSSVRDGKTLSLTVTEKTFFTPSGRLFTGFRYYPTPKNAIEISYFFSRNRFVQQTDVTFLDRPPSSHKHASNWMDGGAINFVRYLPSRNKLKPFLTGGVGISYFNRASFKHKRGGNFGGGVDVPLSGRLSLRMEMRDWILQKPARSGVTHNLTPSFGPVFKF